MKTTIRRTALTLAGLALASGALTGCGGGSSSNSTSSTGSSSTSSSPTSSPSSSGSGAGASSPDDTSTADFCGSYEALIKEAAGSLSGSSAAADLVPTVKKFANKLGEVGTPADIPAAARRGFELSIDAVNKLPDSATQQELLSQASQYSAAQTADAQAFATYVQKKCPDALGNLAPSGVPSAGAS